MIAVTFIAHNPNVLTKFRNTFVGSPVTGWYFEQEFEDFEFESPILYYKNVLIEAYKSRSEGWCITNDINPSHELFKAYILKNANKFWEEAHQKYRSMKVPEILFELLEVESKREQEKLLRGFSLTSHELGAFIIQTHERFGFTFSQYRAKHLPGDIDESQMPDLIHVDEDGRINTIGETSLTERRQRQIVEQKKVTISKFIDKGDKWLCFFFTEHGRAGKEKNNLGQPHVHFISNAWTIPRQDVKDQLTSKKYSLPSVPHINYYTNRNPKNSK